MTHRDMQAGFIGQLLQFQFPKPDPCAVAPARVGGNQQALSLAIDRFAHRTPPAPDALDGKGGRVVVNTHTHPASILAHIVDAIGSDPSQLGNDEVMDPHLLGIPPWAEALGLRFSSPLPTPSSWYLGSFDERGNKVR